MPDGNFSGMVGAIARGDVVTSVPGIAMSQERSLGIDFALSVVTSRIVLFFPTPTGREISMSAYTSEFKVRMLPMLVQY